MGCIYAIDMSLLPKILNSFRVLPIPSPPHVLRILQCLFLKFTWGRTRLWIKKFLLYTSKVIGGLGVPNIAHYYKETQTTPIVQLHVGNLAPLWMSWISNQSLSLPYHGFLLCTVLSL